MLNFLSQLYIKILVGLIVGIIAPIALFIYRKVVAEHFFSFAYYISNKDIEIRTFSLSIVYGNNFNIYSLEGIGDTFKNKHFNVTVVDGYQFIINRIFSYKIIFHPSFAMNDEEMEELPNSMEVSPQSRKFSYRTGINDMADELSVILQTLSQLGLCEYYMNIILNGRKERKERIHLEDTGKMAHEVRRNVSRTGWFNSNSAA